MLISAPHLNQSEPNVRILMATFNGATWLKEQLSSFAEQTYQNWTLWVSDDGSDDDTLDILTDFDRSHPGRIERILDGPKRGVAANYFSLLCHPELPPGFIALADQDDVWLPTKLARAIEALHDVPVDVPNSYAAGYYVVDASLRLKGRSPFWPKGPSFRNAMVQNVMSGHTTVLNPAALALVRRAGIPDVKCHDWWIYILMTGTGSKVHLDPEAVLLYRQHDDNSLGSRLGGRAKLQRILFLFSGSYGRWIEENLNALAKVQALLTSDIQEILHLWKTGSRLWGPKIFSMMRRAKFLRQKNFETVFFFIAFGMYSLSPSSLKRSRRVQISKD